MNVDLRWIIILLANALLILIAGEVNHYLTTVSLHIFIGGLLITFSALRLQMKPAFLANGFTALLIDAVTPLPPGVMFLLLMVVHSVIFAVRGNVTRESLATGTAIAVFANTAIMLVMAVIFAGDSVHQGAFWMRVLVDIALSQAIVAVCAAWFFSLQLATLQLVGIQLDAEQREAQ